MPRPGRSVFRKWRTKSSRQAQLVRSSLAVKLPGKPPRSHSACMSSNALATSGSSSGAMSTRANRPAKD